MLGPHIIYITYTSGNRLTGKLGLAGNLGKELCEVWEVVREELGAENDVFARV